MTGLLSADASNKTWIVSRRKPTLDIDFVLVLKGPVSVTTATSCCIQRTDVSHNFPED